MNRKAIVLIILGAVCLIGYMAYLTMSPNQVSCEVCVDFHGRSECRRASGRDAAEAQMTAVNTACSLVAGGIEEGIACQNTPPARVNCQDR